MSERIMKAVEYSKLPSAFRKEHTLDDIKQSDDYVVQLKYDGCYGIWSHADGMRSRTGEEVKSCAHIEDELRKFIPPGFAVIGEVWHRTWDCATISGKFRQHAPCGDLGFMLHDLVAVSLSDGNPYQSRHAALTALWRGGITRNFTSVVPSMPASDAEVLLRAIPSLAGHYDGVVLKNRWEGYTVGRVKRGEIIKVKPTLSLDLPVVRCTTTLGDKTGRDVHVLTVEYKGVSTDVGSGVPHQLDPLDIVGSIIEVECLGVFPTGKLREPRFKQVRFDKEEPDT